MKNAIIVLALGFGLSVNAQSQMSKPDNSRIGDQNNTQVIVTQSSNSSASTPVVNNPTPVLVTPYSNDRGFEQNRYDRTYRRNSYYNNNDVYQGSYEPPTRNEMRYRQGQQCFTEFEINTRPFSLLNGFYGAGLELSTGCKSSFLFDMASGTSTLFDLQATSGMVGLRFYSKTGMVGRYVSTRARFRSYERGDYFGGNLSLMAGYKANWDGVTLSGEFGLGYQGVDGSYLTLPTWAITLGYKL